VKTGDDIRTAARRVDPRADVEPVLLYRAWRIAVPVKVKGLRERWLVTEVSDYAIECSVLGADIAEAAVRVGRDRWLATMPRKLRRARMRMGRAARKRRRGWS